MIEHVEAYAKLNLSLRVLGCREDGFHEIVSEVQTIDLPDRLTLEIGGAGVRAECDPPLEGANVVERAAEVLLARKGRSVGVRVRVRKTIPIGTGLGGGSSDAAAVLSVLDRLTPPRLPFDTLCELAGSVGSDVPLFLHGGHLRMGGRGEWVERLSSQTAGAFLVVVPPVHCSTAEIYARWDAIRAGSSPEAVDPARGENDLLCAALDAHPELRPYHDAVGRLGALYHGMSGSGSSFFAAFPDADAAENAESRLASLHRADRAFVCRPTTEGHRTLEAM